MWTFFVLVVVPLIILYTLIRIMIYGKSVFKPDFKRVDEKILEKTGLTARWNTPFSKTVYYVFLFGLICIICFTFFIVLYALL